MKKIIVNILTILTIIIFGFNTSYGAWTEVTEEKFKNAVENIDSNLLNGNEKISVSNNKIILKSEKTTFETNYELSNEIVFSSEVEIKQGMSYDEYSNITSGMLVGPMVGYMAVSNIQGVDNKDSGAYFMLLIFLNGMSQIPAIGSENESSYNPENDPEFGKNIIKYTKEQFKEGSTVDDKDTNNTFKYTTQLKDVTDNSCKIITTVKINKNGNFEKIKEDVNKTRNGSESKDKNVLNGKSITLENVNNYNNVSENKKEATNEVADINKIPNTGKTENKVLNSLYEIVGVTLIAIIALGYKIKKK